MLKCDWLIDVILASFPQNPACPTVPVAIFISPFLSHLRTFGSQETMVRVPQVLLAVLLVWGLLSSADPTSPSSG